MKRLMFGVALLAIAAVVAGCGSQTGKAPSQAPNPEQSGKSEAQEERQIIPERNGETVARLGDKVAFCFDDSGFKITGFKVKVDGREVKDPKLEYFILGRDKTPTYYFKPEKVGTYQLEVTPIRQGKKESFTFKTTVKVHQ